MDTQALLQENKRLKQKLKSAQIWMEREIHNQKSLIARQQVQSHTFSIKKQFFSDNIEEITEKKILDFFGEILLLNVSDSIVENIMSAEVSYYQLKENPHADGMGVISCYHKALDIMIESYITKAFRKYAKKQSQLFLRVNDPLEKALNSVVNQGYILSLGRLYHILELIKNKGICYDFGICFSNFIHKYSYLEDVLLSEKFLVLFSQLIKSEILGKKRHIGRVELDETTQAREWLIGNFKNKDCMIYKLISTQEII